MSRTERDPLGELKLPDDALYGVQTARALENFPVSGIREDPVFIRAYVLVKKAAALTNMELGVLDKEKGDAIVRAADEVLDGEHLDQFAVDVFQAGAGTSFNMNVNEVLAHRALQVLGRPLNDHGSISPNDHVNMAQSTNDTFPTASHIAVSLASAPLIEEVTKMASAFRAKGEEFKDIPKSGRTHLMDATPLRLGDEFRAYASALDRAGERLSQRRKDLLEVSLGGTAVGSGVNTAEGYRDLVVKKLGELAGLDLKPPRDSFEALQSRSQLAAFSSSLKELAGELIRISNDLRLMGSGPTTGLSEIILPPVQPGSSIMPGKVNPVMAECLNMVAFQVVGNDAAVTLAAQGGQMELNVFTPLMLHNILSSVKILANYLPVFTEKCVRGIRADEKACLSKLLGNPSLATLLAPRIGYLEAAVLAKEAQEKGLSVKDLAVDKQIITRDEAEKIFDALKMSQGKYQN